MTSSEFRERFLDSNDRFQNAILEAIRAHQAGVLIFEDIARRFDGLEESVEELKRLILEQGAELRALRSRLDNQ